MVVDLAYCGLKRLIVVTLPDSPKAGGFGTAISTWITSVPDRPLSTETFQILLVALHIGWYHKCLDDDEALRLIVSAFSKSERRQAVAPAVRPELMLLDVLLAAPTSKATLSHQTMYFRQLKAKADKANATIQAQREQIERLSTDKATLRATIDRMREEYVAMEERYVSATDAIAELERKNVTIRASYQHKLDDTKGRISGMFEGQLARWLQTSLEAVHMTPPRVEVIEERLEDSLALIEKEIQWLRPLV
jgi:cell division protein FtsB